MHDAGYTMQDVMKGGYNMQDQRCMISKKKPQSYKDPAIYLLAKDHAIKVDEFVKSRHTRESGYPVYR